MPLFLFVLIHIKKKFPLIHSQVLWDKNGVIGKQFKPLIDWQKYTQKKITGSSMKSGHFIPEEDPEETVIKLRKFFFAHI